MSRSLQFLRFALRAVVFLALFIIPLLAHYRIAVEQHQIEQIRSEGATGMAEHILMAMDAVIATGADVESTGASDRELRASASTKINQVQGNVWSFSIFGLSWTDLLAGTESMFTSKTLILAAVWGMLLPLGLTLIFGRVFCSWICPAGLLFEIGHAIRKRLPKAFNLQKKRPVWPGHKYVLLVVGLLMSALLGLPLLGWLYPPALLGRESHAMVDGLFSAAGIISLTGASFFLLAVLLFEFLVSPRIWCQSLCPGGALYALFGARRVVRIKNDTSACTHCAACIQACPMDLNPMSDTLGMECDNCLACLPSCQPKSLSLRLARRSSDGGNNT